MTEGTVTEATVPVPIEVTVAPTTEPMPNVLAFEVFGFTIDAMAIVFLLLCGLIILFLWHAHKYESKFNVYDLIMEDGQASPPRVVLFLALVVSTWVVVHQTLTASLSDVVFSTWLISFVLPIVMAIYKSKPKQKKVAP